MTDDELDFIIRTRDESSAQTAKARAEFKALADQAATTGAVLQTQLGGSFTNVTNLVERSGGKIREFSRAGSELAIVAAAMGPDFQRMLGPLGEFVHIAGDAGLVTHAIVDLAPGALASAKAVAQLAAQEVAEAVAGGAATTATMAFSLALRAIPIVTIIAGLAELVHQIGQVGNTMNEFSSDDVTRTKAALQALTEQAGINKDSTGELGDAYRKLQAHLESLNPKISDNTGLTMDATAAGGAFAAMQRDRVRAYDEETAATVQAAKEGAAWFTVLNGLAGSQGDVNAAASQSVAPLNSEAGALDNVAAAAWAAAQGLYNANLQAAQLAKIRAAGPLGGAGFTADTSLGGIGFTGPLAPDATPLGATHHYGGRGSGGGGGAASVTAEAAKAAREAAAEIAKAYSVTKAAGDSYYDAAHQKNLRAIDDAHALANQKISEDRRAVDAALANQLRLNAAPVTAAEKALRDEQTQEQLRNLQESRDTAVAGGDAIAIRDANEALVNFQAQMNIDQLRAQQALADDTARKKAAADQSSIDARQTAEDTAYAKKKTDEDARVAYLKKVFDDHNAALAASKKATEGLANVETQRFLQENLILAKEALAAGTGSKYDVKAAEHALAAFKGAGAGSQSLAGKELPGLPASGSVSGSGFGKGLAGISADRGSPVTINLTIQTPGLVDPYGQTANDIAAFLIPALKRVLDQQNTKL